MGEGEWEWWVCGVWGGSREGWAWMRWLWWWVWGVIGCPLEVVRICRVRERERERKGQSQRESGFGGGCGV